MWIKSASVNCANLVNISATISEIYFFPKGLLFWRALYVNTRQKTKGGTYINRHSSLHFTNFSNFSYRTKLNHLAFLANALSTSFVGQCSRWHCSKRSASSRSSVIVERIDVSVRYNLAKTRSDSDIVTISVPMICTQQSASLGQGVYII